MPQESEDTLRGVVRIGKVTWILLWTLVLAGFVRDVPGAEPGAVAEGFNGFFLLLCLAGFPFAPAVGLPLMHVLRTSPSALVAGLIAMVIAGYLQWFVLVPRVWRVFRNGKELKW